MEIGSASKAKQRTLSQGFHHNSWSVSVSSASLEEPACGGSLWRSWRCRPLWRTTNSRCHVSGVGTCPGASQEETDHQILHRGGFAVKRRLDWHRSGLKSWALSSTPVPPNGWKSCEHSLMEFDYQKPWLILTMYRQQWELPVAYSHRQAGWLRPCVNDAGSNCKYECQIIVFLETLEPKCLRKVMQNSRIWAPWLEWTLPEKQKNRSSCNIFFHLIYSYSKNALMLDDPYQQMRRCFQKWYLMTNHEMKHSNKSNRSSVLHH